jgi:hypothetical protein
LVLLGLWPWALLYPTPVPFGLGQISPLLRELWDWAWQGLPWWRATGGGHAAETWIQPLPGMAVATGVALGLLIPMGLGYLVLRHPAHRPWWLLAVLVGGVLLQMLSSLMTYGPAHFGAWWTSPVVGGVLSALLAGGVMHMLPRQVVWGGLMLMVLCLLVLLNAMAEPPYLHESLEIWAQGRFIRFHGATQWLGRLWPYAVLAHLLWRGWRYLRARHE